MIRRLFMFLVVLIFTKYIIAQFKQERARINYCNPKYFKECYAITRRTGRREPYKTNLTLTSRYLSDNNVTMRIIMLGGITVEVLKIKVCDGIHIDWITEYMKTYSNIPYVCPIKAGSYGVYNMELPPKNTPQRIRVLLEGKFRVNFYLQTTKTEEIMVECTLTMYS